MAGIFVDSFNHYTTLTGISSYTNKWDFAFNGVIATVPSIARTGTRCLQIAGGNSGPVKNLAPQQTAPSYTKLIQGVAMNFDGVQGDGDIMRFVYAAPFTQVTNIGVTLNADGTISVYRGAGDSGQATLGTSAAAFVFSPTNALWNYIEVKCLFHASAGSVEVRFCPPGGPMAVILSISGVKTVALAAAPQTNQVALFARAGLTQNCYMADYYCSDWSDGSTYLGGVRIYADLPFANGSPLEFTPSSGTNWQNVDEVPPNNSDYNSGTLGQSDQYQHDVTGVPSNASILAVQHVMDAMTDSGARAITSSVEGTPHANSVYLTNNLAMYTYLYDTDPGTGLPWSGADFPMNFGPEVTV